MNAPQPTPLRPRDEAPAPLSPHLQAALNRINAVAERVIARNPEIFREQAEAEARREGAAK